MTWRCVGCVTDQPDIPGRSPPGFPRCLACSRRDGALSVDAMHRVMAASDMPATYADELAARSKPAPSDPRDPPIVITPRPAEIPPWPWFKRTLSVHFLPTSEQAVLQWSALAKRHGGATNWEEAAQCVEWCFAAGHARGATVRWAEHAVPFAERWRVLRAKSKSSPQPPKESE